MKKILIAIALAAQPGAAAQSRAWAPSLEPLNAIEVPAPQAVPARERADGSEALASIKRSAETALRSARPALEAEVAAVKAALAAGLPAGTDPEDPAVRNLIAPFVSLYLRAAESALPRISPRDERDYADGFFADFFLPEDNRPEHVSVLSGYLSALAAHRARTDYNYKVGTITDGGDEAMAKGGELLILAGEYALRPRDEAAAVLAHELQHNEHRHYMQYQVVTAVNKMLAMETGGASEDAAKLAENYYKWLCEYQADSAAAEMMRKAGFDPAGLKAVLAGLPGGTAADLRRDDHPPVRLRLANLAAAGLP